MTSDTRFDIFLVCPPGLEPALAAELTENGFAKCRPQAGGVLIKGDWNAVWRANLQIRGATRVLAQIGEFRANHLNMLAQNARQIPWSELFYPGQKVRVDASCRKSRIYHNGAAEERVADAIAAIALADIDPEASIVVRARLDKDICTLSIDTSGLPLHKRGYKQAVAKAPMRETLAALLLREAGYDGRMPLLDPMCGSGTFVIEAAQLAAGLAPGQDRDFTFQQLENYTPEPFEALKARPPHPRSDLVCYGFDRDPGAVRMASENAQRAGVSDRTRFEACEIKDLVRPEGPEGLVMVNPPYGTRIGDKRAVHGLYKVFGQVMRERFSGWRVGLVTSDESLVRMTGLHIESKSAVIDHGGVKIRLHQTGPLR